MVNNSSRSTLTLFFTAPSYTVSLNYHGKPKINWSNNIDHVIDLISRNFLEDAGESVGIDATVRSFAFGAPATDWFKFSLNQPKYTRPDVAHLEESRVEYRFGPPHVELFTLPPRGFRLFSNTIHTRPTATRGTLCVDQINNDVRIRRWEGGGKRRGRGAGELRNSIKNSCAAGLQLWNYYAVKVLLVVGNAKLWSHWIINCQLARPFCERRTQETEETGGRGVNWTDQYGTPGSGAFAFLRATDAVTERGVPYPKYFGNLGDAVDQS